MSKTTVLAAVLCVASLATASGVAAQGAPNVRQACMSSIVTLCPDELKAKDRPAIRACLIKNFDKTTPDCQAAMKAMAAKAPPTPPPAAH